MRILYVEDNALDADLVRRALLRDPAQVVVELAPTLADARAALAAPLRFDVVLLDLNLPDGRGLELLAEIRARALPLAVVALTSQGDESVVMTALRGGADDYLAKTEHYPERVLATAHAALAAYRVDAARHARRLQVLYVEHHALDIDLTQRHFAARAPNLLLHCVGSMAEALAHLASGPAAGPAAVDVLLVDFRLVGDTGLDLLKTVRQDLGLDLPVVLVTGQGNEDVAALAMRLGATDYVVKREGYLIALPAVIENAFHRVQAGREAAALRALNVTLEQRVAERTAGMAAAKEAAEAASRGKSEFLARMSHDLRTPLNAVLGFSQLLEFDPVVAASPATGQKVRQVHAAGRHLLEMIDDLLDLSRIESGGLRLSLEPIEVGALLRECVALTESLAAVRGVVVQCEGLDRRLCAAADRLRLRQVLVNLLSNAIKYNRPQGRVDVTVGGDAAEVYIDVRDTGRGLTPEQQSGLFQPFNRVGAEKGDVEGTGLGLVIARQLVEAMGGRIEVRSVPAQGSTFTVHLRRESRPDDAAPAPTAVLPLPAASGAPVRRVLYIEDNPVNTALMQEMLSLRGGLELEVAGTGAAGLAAARRSRPDLLLVDIGLPDMNGLAVVRSLRADPLTARLPCVAVSAYALEDDEREARAAGCVGYLTKPFALARLYAEIDRHLP
jgi:signal transduction histidine kinase/AmiR/NasT family two-component response regulator